MDVIELDRHLPVKALAVACRLDQPVYACPLLWLLREVAVLLTADQHLQQLADRVLP